MTERLHPDDLEALADLVAERLDELALPPRRLFTAAEAARMLAVDRGWIYEHQDELGVIRLSSGGTRPRLRFDPERLLDALTARRDGKASDARQPVPRRARRRRAPQTTVAGSPLLPIRPPGRAP